MTTLLVTGTVALLCNYPIIPGSDPPTPQDTLVCTYPLGTMASGDTPKVGDILQLEYTVDPTAEQPMTSIAYSFNGEPFFPDDGPAVFDILAGYKYGFTVTPQPGASVNLTMILEGTAEAIIPSNSVDLVPNWSMVESNPSRVLATMQIVDSSGAGVFANITDIEDVTPPPPPVTPTPPPPPPTATPQSVSPPPASTSGGGGAMDWTLLIELWFALRVRWNRLFNLGPVWRKYDPAVPPPLPTTKKITIYIASENDE